MCCNTILNVLKSLKSLRIEKILQKHRGNFISYEMKIVFSVHVLLIPIVSVLLTQFHINKISEEIWRKSTVQHHIKEKKKKTTYWSCWCMGKAICGGTLMNLSLSSKPTGLVSSFRSLSSCSTTCCSQFFSHRLRISSLICSAHCVP